MRSLTFKLLVLAVALAIFLPTITLAATPTAFLERSKVIATGKQIRAYSVPTRDRDGEVQYYDITITIPVLNNGQPNVSDIRARAVKSPMVDINDFTPGTYRADGIPCTLVTSPFGGRTEATFTCTSSHYTLTAVWYTGPIRNHPFEAELTEAGVDKVPGGNHYAWGKVGNTDNGRWWNFCIDFNDANNILAVRQANNTLTVHNYGVDSTSDCHVNFTKTKP
jgi:hypothetical protein